MFKRVKGAILAAVAAFFMWISGATPAMAADSGWGSGSAPNPFQGGTAYQLPAVNSVVANLLQTAHVYGSILGALGIVVGFLYMHFNHISPNAKARGIEIIMVSIVALLGLYFSPQIYQVLTNL